ncbi:hypothetical protein DDZ13_02650 [Coraliomargarita sinensis]|uniref:Uncharacterized protein n=1 Tax=Coraliomargarita sinensis TaxID=2174842 RepID=A0A317ZNA6_9BACT|nr:hypothetical protein [Coraliomargarita sinensis]PXA04881.1 hypothetical protein DDZ13_02650 [Coraliomargarita sinensis]
MLRILKGVLRWCFTWLYFVLLTCFVGAVLGVLSHVVLGPLFVDEPDFTYLSAFGFMNGLKYGGVWAGGLAIVLCVMRARKEYLVNHEEGGERR